MLDGSLLESNTALQALSAESHRGLLAEIRAGVVESISHGSLLVNNLAGVDGVTDYTLGKMLLLALNDGNGTLTVNDGLDFCKTNISNKKRKRNEWEGKYR